MKNPFFDL